MSFQKRLENANISKRDAVDRLDDYINALPKDEQLALRELLSNFPVRVGFDALKEEGYQITRDTVTKWVKRYVVQG